MQVALYKSYIKDTLKIIIGNKNKKVYVVYLDDDIGYCVSAIERSIDQVVCGGFICLRLVVDLLIKNYDSITKFTIESICFYNTLYGIHDPNTEFKLVLDAYISNGIYTIAIMKGIQACKSLIVGQVQLEELILNLDSKAGIIQRKWNEAISCPDYLLCRRRLFREFEGFKI